MLTAHGRAAGARLRVRDRAPALRRRAARGRRGAADARCSRAPRALAEAVFGTAHAQDGQDPAHSTLYGLYWLCGEPGGRAAAADRGRRRALGGRAEPALPGRAGAAGGGPAGAAGDRRAARRAGRRAGVAGRVRDRARDAPAPPAGARRGGRHRVRAGQARRRARRSWRRASRPRAATRCCSRSCCARRRSSGRADEADAVRTTVPRAHGHGAHPHALPARRWRSPARPPCSATRRASRASPRSPGSARPRRRAELRRSPTRTWSTRRTRASCTRWCGRRWRRTSARSARACTARRRACCTRTARSDGVVATHLLAAEPTNDPWAAEILASAGRRALAEGAPDVALRLLARAEPKDAGILLALGLAQVRTGADPLPALDEAIATGDAGDRGRRDARSPPPR